MILFAALRSRRWNGPQCVMLGCLEKQSIQGMHACGEKTAVEEIQRNVTEQTVQTRIEQPEWETKTRSRGEVN